MPVMSSADGEMVTNNNSQAALVMASIKHEEMVIQQQQATPQPQGSEVMAAGDGSAHLQHLHGVNLCGGCGLKIADRFYLVAVERAWHSECLRCSECHKPLDTAFSCFARQSRIYCRADYNRLFGLKRCSRCCLPLGSNELVMRARDAVFHLSCFTCAACNQPLAKGDIFGMRDGVIYCRLHYEMFHAGGLNGDSPCDLSCAGGGGGGGAGGGGGGGGGSGPNHGLLPPANFALGESMSPGHVMNVLGADSDVGYHHLHAGGPAPASLRNFGGVGPASVGGAGGYGPGPNGVDYVGQSTPASLIGGSAFFPAIGALGGLGGVVGHAGGASSAANGVQKGRPRKRKMTPASASSAGGAASIHSSVHAAGLAANLRPIGNGIDLLTGTEMSSSLDGLMYDTSSNSGGSGGGGGGSGGGSGGAGAGGGGGAGGGSGGPLGAGSQQQRTKRMRTSFKHHQLRTMKSYFAINQNPDAKDLKQLAQKTGLSKRVLQVWFQNARAKWRRNMMRQQDGGGGGAGGGSGAGSSGSGGPKDADLSGVGSGAAGDHLGHHVAHGSARVPTSLGELTPPGSAGIHSGVSNDEANSNLVFSDLY